MVNALQEVIVSLPRCDCDHQKGWPCTSQVTSPKSQNGLTRKALAAKPQRRPGWDLMEFGTKADMPLATGERREELCPTFQFPYW